MVILTFGKPNKKEKTVSEGDVVLVVGDRKDSHTSALVGIVERVDPTSAFGERVYLKLPTVRVPFTGGLPAKATQYTFTTNRTAEIYRGPEEIATYLDSRSQKDVADKVRSLTPPYNARKLLA